MAIFYILLIGFLAVPAAFATAILALVLSRTRIGLARPTARFVLLGTMIPAAMIGWGLFLVWPWPWFEPPPPVAMRDGIPPGPWLLIASMPIWGLCLAVSRLIL